MGRLIVRAVVLIASVLWGALGGPPVAWSQTCDDQGDIPFRVIQVDPSIPGERCLSCSGPAFRQSNLTPISLIRDAVQRTGSCQFYAANDVAVFSPYGDWSCVLLQECSGSSNSVPGTNNDFCLGSRATSVQILVDTLITVHTPGESPECASRSLRSTLGAGQAQNRFRFRGQAGAALVVSVKPDNRSGHNNGQAILRVASPDGHIETTGTLPLKLSGTLPVSGEYLITVREADVDPAHRFRGTYHLIVEGASGTRLEPLLPVSPAQ